MRLLSSSYYSPLIGQPFPIGEQKADGGADSRVRQLADSNEMSNTISERIRYSSGKSSLSDFIAAVSSADPQGRAGT
jgi:hypothetical protein